MGYTTEFEGTLKFNRELKASEILKIQTISGENPDDHKDWEPYKADDCLSYIQYTLTKELDGIQWDGGEKFYYAVEALNFLLHNLRKDSPDLRVSGQLLANGEEAFDNWYICIDEDGWAYRKEIPKPEDAVECPHCGEGFRLKDLN